MVRVRPGVVLVPTVLGMVGAWASAQDCRLRLLPSDPGAGLHFGMSLAASSHRLVIGVEGDDYAGDDTGSASVYLETEAGWVLEARLTAFPPVGVSLFGHAVSTNDDLTLVGSPYDTGLSGVSGAAHLFERNGTLWSHDAKLTPLDGAYWDACGTSVAWSRS